MTTTTLTYRTAPSAARRETMPSSMLVAIRARCAALFSVKLDARERYLSQACDHADLAVRERAWKAYEDSLATISRIGQ